ncbi:TfoX/Sxy family transcriptional regulator of competence genes [Nocardia transvalensis]|uniref:TfoX/Sxy family transcriptional regulator of competence genes n=1 Tax=Nocardia transvalensis TaxID=37333 RepID=A0A7W9UH27_9NOCA|nr:TfoX/Sxy family protein [Nocardia transvalensis]MBB5912270.1 TfoX/Sxy family transcriptional regulator of competence genes [Nocardia transvalensis]
MAYDEELADRIRDLLGPALPEVVEKKMFGGLAFLLGGNMAVAASGKGGLMVRVDPDEADALLEADTVARMVMGGREMRNWLRISAEAVGDDDVLHEWITRGLAYARTLPAKRAR